MLWEILCETTRMRRGRGTKQEAWILPVHFCHSAGSSTTTDRQFWRALLARTTIERLELQKAFALFQCCLSSSGYAIFPASTSSDTSLPVTASRGGGSADGSLPVGMSYAQFISVTWSLSTWSRSNPVAIFQDEHPPHNCARHQQARRLCIDVAVIYDSKKRT